MIRCLAAIGLALGVLGVASQDVIARTYTFVDLGVGSSYSPEPAESFAASINNNGDVAGYINYRYRIGSRYGAAMRASAPFTTGQPRSASLQTMIAANPERGLAASS